MTIWNTNILINEITAETTPLFKAVKNDDANIFTPLIRYETAYILIASVVSSSRLLS